MTHILVGKKQTAYTLLLFYQVVTIIIFIFVESYLPQIFSKKWQEIIIIWSIFYSFIYIILRYFSGDKDFLSIDKIFLYAFIYFHFDYLVSYSIGLVKYDPTVFSYSDLANYTTYYLGLCLFIFLFSYNIFSSPRRIHTKPGITSIKGIRNNRAFFIIGKSLILIGFLMVIYFIYDFGYSDLLSRSYGFSLFYSGSFNTTAFTAGKSILSVGILFLIIDYFQSSDRHFLDKLYNILLVFVVLIYAILILYIFSVRSWLLIDIILPSILAYHYFRKRIQAKWLLIGLGIFIVSSFVIEIARTSEIKSINGYINTFSDTIKNNNEVIGNITSLQWRTYRNVNESIGLVKLQDEWFYGKTMLGGILAGIPIAGKYITNGWYEPPSTWLARNLHPWFYDNNEGIGFSFPAEIYINFGIIGAIVFFFIIGYLLSKLYIHIIIPQVTTIFRLLFYFTLVPNLLFALRQNIASISRPIFYLFLSLAIVGVTSYLVSANKSAISVKKSAVISDIYK